VPVRTFGLGFGLDKFAGMDASGHSGTIYGFSSHLTFLPEKKLGVVVLLNKGTSGLRVKFFTVAGINLK
jgi:CubicO group peptidase (beta-lactamase class C family)